jgi:iron complex outermembrane recepter protein
MKYVTRVAGSKIRTKPALLRSVAVIAVTTAAALLSRTAAFAQDADSGTGENVSTERVVVTGSRVIQNQLDAPVPTTALSVTDLQNLGGSAELSETLRELPQLSFSTSISTEGIGTTGNGNNNAAFLNLRNLGSVRTLVLENGIRLPPNGSLGSTDVNLIPEALVQRVDTVTGGASAAYGSDAVSGVVNYILDTNYVGTKADIEGGSSQYGDNQTTKLELTHGEDFDGGRLHLLADYEYFRNYGADSGDGRSWLELSRQTVPNPAVTATNPASATNPSRVTFNNVSSYSGTYGGLITSGPASIVDTQFLPGGATAPFQLGSTLIPSQYLMVGGQGMQPAPGYDEGFIAHEIRNVGFFSASYDITPDLNAFAQVEFAGDAAHLLNVGGQENAPGLNFTIFSGNPYLPANIQSALTTAGASSFGLGRISDDLGGVPTVYTYDNTARLLGGVSGKLLGGAFDASYSHGTTVLTNATDHDPILDNLYNAADAVANPAVGGVAGVAPGTPVCASSLTHPGNGCVPINLFGVGSPSAGAINYATGVSSFHAFSQEDFAQINFRRNLFDDWAGTVTGAVGASYRRDQVNQTSDAISQSRVVALPTGATAATVNSLGFAGLPAGISNQLGGFDRSDFSPISGSYDVWEFYGESLVPLLHDAPIARSIDLDLAGRCADYSEVGGCTASWKAGVVYQTPIDDLRLRGSISRDVRAANISELFAPGTQGTATTSSPFYNDNKQFQVNTLTTGNPNLKPERATTSTFGFVYAPEWLSGFSASWDYYNIDIENVIGQLGGTTILSLCGNGSVPAYCKLITFSGNPGNATTTGSSGLSAVVVNETLNQAQMFQHGFDVNMSYQSPLDTFVDGWEGDISFRLVMEYLFSAGSQNTNAPLIIASGYVTDPKYQTVATVGYDRGPFYIGVTFRYIPDTLAPQLVAGTPNSAATQDITSVSSRLYNNLALHYDVPTPLGFGPDTWQIYLDVNNLFNIAPPYVANTTNGLSVFNIGGGSYTNVNVFDKIGRNYVLGVRLQM